MVSFSKAKINLGLNVMRKRDDGYHDLSTVFYPIGLFDILEINIDKELKITYSGLPVDGDDAGNLCVRAYELLKQDFNIDPVRIHLHKAIPMGAGLGGGSSDGASALLTMNSIFNLNLTVDELAKYALELGSDCPFFLNPIPSIASGRGEELEEISIDLSGYKIVLVYPNVPISTANAFGRLKDDHGKSPIRELDKQPIENWKDFLFNDFEPGTFLVYPGLKDIKDKLYEQGAIYSSMTGTGSGIYGIFSKQLNVDKSKFGSDLTWFQD